MAVKVNSSSRRIDRHRPRSLGFHSIYAFTRGVEIAKVALFDYTLAYMCVSMYSNVIFSCYCHGMVCD